VNRPTILQHTRWLLPLLLLAVAIGAPAPAAAVGIIPVTAVSPNTGSLAGGTTVTITGARFTAGARVTIGGVAATAVVVVNGSTIVCRTLPHAAGAVTVAVSVTDPGPATGSLASGYTYASGGITQTNPAPVAQEFPGATAGSNANSIAVGPDGNLWFTEFDVSRIGRITPAGVVTEFATGITAGNYPSGIAAGADGNLWFTELGGKIGRITTAGVVTEFATGITAGSQPTLIAAGPDGNLWFTEFQNNKIGRITTAGAIAEFNVRTANSYPYGIAAGPDGNLWFTGYDRIDVLVIAPLAITSLSPINGPATTITSVTITGVGFAPDATVSFGGIAALARVNSPISITADAPTHGPGTVDVVVTTGGSTATVHGFTYGTSDPAPPPRLPESPVTHPASLPPARGGPTGGAPDPAPPPRPLFPPPA
jgi:streptogramin lyase